MDFDSPDVEKDFPGLYASTEIGHKDSDGQWTVWATTPPAIRFVDGQWLWLDCCRLVE
jgi:hypothetical protein